MAGVDIREFVGDFRIGELIGSGSNSQVRLAVHQGTLQRVAVKIIGITQPSTWHQAFREASILKEVGVHRNIIKFIAIHHDERYCYLFMEYATGGDLYSYVQKHGPLEEGIARNFCKQIVESLLFCHTHSITHHDVKLENILVATDSTLRLSDFGHAHKIDPGQDITFFGGSPLYMPPELFSILPHNHQVDVWSLGVCLYFMVFGTFPFEASRYEDLEERVLFDDVMFPGTISDSLLNLLQGMLEKDPSKRFTLNEVRKHKWTIIESRPMTLYGAGSSPQAGRDKYKKSNGWPPY